MMITEGNGLDLATFINSATRNGSGGFGDGDGWGGGNGFLWLLLFLIMGGRGWGNGWGGNGGEGSQAVEKAVVEARAAGLSDQVVLDAIHCSDAAIAQIASTLNCGLGDVRNALCSLDKGLLQLSSQVGMSGQEIINAIQSGNCALTSQLANCCCEMKQLVTTMNYENRIANMQQTEQLVGVMNAGFLNVGNKIDAGFQGLHEYLTSEKIDGLRQKITTLENAANNANQTAAINAYVNAAVTPVANRVTELLSRIPPEAVPAYPAPQFNTGYFTVNRGCGWTAPACGCGYNNSYYGA